MKSFIRALAVLPLMLVSGACMAASSHEADYTKTLGVFQHAGASGSFFSNSYAYAVFPNVGSGAVGIGGAYGRGRVYSHGAYIGDTKITQVSLGVQAGGKSFSEIIFFEDKRALDDFQAGHFELGSDASVVAITAGANADASTTGSSTGSSAGQHDATTHGTYKKGAAVFTVAKGGLMGAADVSGQKFSYTSRQMQ